MGVLHVGELLTLPVLRGARVLAGHRGLDHEVTNVNVMEVPDIEAYVHPGEVLLTTLYPLRDDLAQVAELVRRLHAAMLSALANPKRLLVLCSMVEKERPVGELAELVGLSDAALSQHLSKMRALGLVRSRRDGQTIYYSLASDDVRAVLETLHRRFCEIN